MSLAAFIEVAVRTKSSKQANYRRLRERAKALEIRDSVIVAAQNLVPLDPKWDHGNMVVGIHGPLSNVVADSRW